MGRDKRKSTEISQDNKDQPSATPSGNHTNKNGHRVKHNNDYKNNKRNGATETKGASVVGDNVRLPQSQQQAAATTRPYNKSKYDKNNNKNSNNSEKKERKEWPADQLWSKSKKKRMRTLKAKHVEKEDVNHEHEPTTNSASDNKKIIEFAISSG